MSKFKSNGNTPLMKKILVVVFFLACYRIGSFVPLPGINISVLNKIMDQATGMIEMFNVLTGGAVSRMSIFSLNNS